MQINHKAKAVVLLSGGLDSTTVLAYARTENFDIHALSFNYGQRHSIELEAVKKILAQNPIREHKIINIDLRQWGGSALTSDVSVPKVDQFVQSDEIPITYVPARNLIFLSFAIGYAEVIGSQDLFLGVNAIDYSNYPDCRPEFIEAFEKTANLATSAGVGGKKFRIHSPLINLTKAQIIKMGTELGVDYSITSSCYDPSPRGEACGKCDACHLRLAGFKANGLKDPATYSSDIQFG